MKREYEFSRGKRGAVIPTTGKTRITMYRSAEGEYSKAPQLAGELVRSHPDVIVVENNNARQVRAAMTVSRREF